MAKLSCYWHSNGPPENYFVVLPLNKYDIIAETFPSVILGSDEFYWRIYEPYLHGWAPTIEEAKSMAEENLKSRGYTFIDQKVLNLK